jgi:hypothetical protein
MYYIKQIHVILLRMKKLTGSYEIYSIRGFTKPFNHLDILLMLLHYITYFQMTIKNFKDNNNIPLFTIAE